MMGSVHLVVDVVGWFASGSSFTSLVPSRLVDTRSPLVPVVAGGQLDVSVLGRGGVPGSGVGAVVLNVTATDAVSAGYVTVWPKGDDAAGGVVVEFLAGGAGGEFGGGEGGCRRQGVVVATPMSRR